MDMNTNRVTDASNRDIAPPQAELPERPMGNWNNNTAPSAPVRTICAWHPNFDPTDPANIGASHGICATCQRRMEREGSW